MTTTVAAQALADILARENAALTALAFAGVAALADEKERALAALRRAPATPVAPKIAAHLEQLVAENKRLLQRAIYVQGQLIACVGKAARRTQDSTAPRYGRTGGWARDPRPRPTALLARI